MKNADFTASLNTRRDKLSSAKLSKKRVQARNPFRIHFSDLYSPLTPAPNPTGPPPRMPDQDDPHPKPETTASKSNIMLRKWNMWDKLGIKHLSIQFLCSFKSFLKNSNRNWFFAQTRKGLPLALTISFTIIKDYKNPAKLAVIFIKIIFSSKLR